MCVSVSASWVQSTCAGLTNINKWSLLGMKNKSEGAAEVMITSAFPLEGRALNDLLSSLKKRFGGKELRPTIQVDPALIGGVRIQVGDEVMDSSVKAQLAQMQASLGA